MDFTADSSPLLTLPTELRLLIYSLVLLDDPAITISTARLTGTPHDIIHCLYGERRAPCPGIPVNHVPVVEIRYDPSLLSATRPATRQAVSSQAIETHEYSTLLSLLLVNKLVCEELKEHLKMPCNRNTSLYIQYPHGLHVFKTRTPHLLRQAKSVHLAGTYFPADSLRRKLSYEIVERRTGTDLPPNTTYDESSAPTTTRTVSRAGIDYYGNLKPDSVSQLRDLITCTLGPEPSYPIAKLEMRIYYHGCDAYTHVWNDGASPIVLALRHIAGGEILIEIWRGRYGTGIYLAVKPPLPGQERNKVVTTVWRKLEERPEGAAGGPGNRADASVPRCGAWVVDEHWPAHDDNHTPPRGSSGDKSVSRSM